MPNYIWLGSGGSESLNVDKCRCLTGRNVILFPDCKQFEKWQKKATELSKAYNTSFTVSDLIERNATAEEYQAGTDLADYLIKFSPSDFHRAKTPINPLSIMETNNHTVEETAKTIERSKQQPGLNDCSSAYVSSDGRLLIPTPPDRRTYFTVYTGGVEAYNNRSETPIMIPFNDVDTDGMKQVFINHQSLTIAV